MVHVTVSSFWFVVKRGYLPVKLPKLNIATIDQSLGLFDCLSVICADPRDHVVEVTVITDQIGAVFGHGPHSLDQVGSATLSVTDGYRTRAVMSEINSVRLADTSELWDVHRAERRPVSHGSRAACL